MKVTEYLVLLHMVFSGLAMHARPESLLIFQGMQGQPLSDAAGMNVAHQVLTGLVQKASPMLVSQDVWNHILERCDRCKKAMAQKDSLHEQVNLLVQEVNQKIEQGSLLSLLNSQLNGAWYQQKYPMLAALDGDQNKAVMFDYFCMHVDELVSSWTAYRLSGAYVLLLPTTTTSFNVQPMQAISKSQLLVIHKDLQFVGLAVVLAGLFQVRGVSWSFYLTGHGYHADASHPKSMIAGMTIEQFQQFLNLLQDRVKTNILVYSSCFSSGMHLVDPYQIDSNRFNEVESIKLNSKSGTDLKLKYPVVATCLTDAPVYVFGMPAGLKLPPYDTSLLLEPSDISQGKLNWYLMQNFTKFVRSALNQKQLKEVTQSVMVYQECSSQTCNLAKLENIPLVRRPGTTFFVPIDTTYVDFVIHNKKQIKEVDGKHGLLWYVKQYDGVIRFKQRIAQCISMIPGDGVIWMRGLQAPDFSFRDVFRQAFFSVEDMHGVQIFLCDEFVCRDATSQVVTWHQVMALPKSSWIPKDLLAGDGGLCCYQQGGDGYAVAVNKVGVVQTPYKLSATQQKAIQLLWLLLRKESMIQEDLSADQLWSQDRLQERKKTYDKLLDDCRRQAICQ